MRTSASTLWTISLPADERFEISGTRYPGARDVEIHAFQVSNGWASGRVEITGHARRSDGDFGLQNRIVSVKPDDERVPAAIREEIARVMGHAERFISKVQS